MPRQLSSGMRSQLSFILQVRDNNLNQENSLDKNFNMDEKYEQVVFLRGDRGASYLWTIIIAQFSFAKV